MTGYQSFIVVSFFVFLSSGIQSKETCFAQQNLAAKKRPGACQRAMTCFKKVNDFLLDEKILILAQEDFETEDDIVWAGRRIDERLRIENDGREKIILTLL